MSDETPVYENMPTLSVRGLIADRLKTACGDLLDAQGVEEWADRLSRRPTRVTGLRDGWLIEQDGRELGADMRQLLTRHAAQAAPKPTGPVPTANMLVGLGFTMPGGRALPASRRGL